MKLSKSLSQYRQRIQLNLFPWIEEGYGELTKKQKQLVTTLEMIRVEEFSNSQLPDRVHTALIQRHFITSTLPHFLKTALLT